MLIIFMINKTSSYVGTFQQTSSKEALIPSMYKRLDDPLTIGLDLVTCNFSNNRSILSNRTGINICHECYIKEYY